MALMPVEDALRRILSTAKPLPAETITLEQSLDRVLAQEVVARRSQPPFAASAMDGYAVVQSDLASLPTTLKVVGTSAAGLGFRRVVHPGEAVRILTGAPVPEGADTIVIQENTVCDGHVLTILEHSPPGRHIRRAGLDFQKGDVLLRAPTRLRPRDLGLAAAANTPIVRVRRKPRLVLFATGDELVLPGQKPKPDQIVSSNSHAIAAMAQRLGAEVINLGIVEDNLKATVAAVRKGLGADILLTTGGASVGDHDFVQEAFKACGIKIDFWKIAIRPGKPFMYGRKAKTHVMGLPGNPVSALVTALLFLKPLIDALLGLQHLSEPEYAVVEQDMPANDNRQDYVRAILTVEADGRRRVRPFSVQDSSMQRILQQADCLIIRPPHAPPCKTGDMVQIMTLDF